MSLIQEWQQLTIGQFIEQHCTFPLSNGLRAIINCDRRGDLPPKIMAEFSSEADIYRIRRVGRQSGSAIIAAMKTLGWEPQPDRKEINDLCHSAVLQLDCVAARLQRFAGANAGLAKRVRGIERQVSRAAGDLQALQDEFCGSLDTVD